MAERRRTQQRTAKSRSPFSGIFAIVAIIAVIFLLLNVLKIGWAVLGFLAPLFLIASLILNRFVAIDYVKMLVNTLKTDLPRGILYSVLSFVGSPLLFLYFFIRSYASSSFKKKVDKKRAETKENSKYEEYEEVEDEDDFLELPDLDTEPPKEKLKDTGYENLFE